MANVDHQQILVKGVEIWNKWRRKHPRVRPDLTGLDLRKIYHDGNLAGVDLTDCDLRRVRFASSDLTGARLDASDLRSSELERTSGLAAPALAQADLTGAKLPANVQEFRATSVVNEHIVAARRLWAVMMLACTYTLVFALSVDDLSLIKNAPSQILPNVSASAPTHTVFWMIPMFLLVLFVLFQFHFQAAGEGIAQLPRVFPDGRAREEWFHPWFVTSILRERDSVKRDLVFGVAWLSVWATPLVAMFAWYQFLPTHEIAVSILQVLFLTVFAFTWLQARLSSPPVISNASDPGGKGHAYRTSFVAALFSVLICLITTILSVAAYYGWSVPLVKLHPVIRDAQVSERVGGTVVAGGVGGNVGGIPTIIPAVLRNKNLRRVDARRAFLVKADLRDSDLRRADLREADLTEADLTQVNLERADLRGATLFQAMMNQANLTGADLRIGLQALTFRNLFSSMQIWKMQIFQESERTAPTFQERTFVERGLKVQISERRLVLSLIK